MAGNPDRGMENRGIVLDILSEVLDKGSFVHLVLNQALQKYQYLDKSDRAFITRVTEGTLEYLLQIDHIINKYSKTKTDKMKPLIRNLLRMSVYQILYMDRVPDSAVCNEAVKLAVKRRFTGLKGFVNGVLRTISREKASLVFDSPSLAYSIPQWMYDMWEKEYGSAKAEMIAASFLEDRPTWVRCNLSRASREAILKSLDSQGVMVKELDCLPSVLAISGYDHMEGLECFQNGWIQVQDATSAFVGELADPKEGDYIIDVCAAPGGKSLHLADKMKGTGMVEARDLSYQKTALIEENVARSGAANIKAVVWDALVPDEDAREKADIVIADLPCSGLGIIGKKPDIKYNMTMDKMRELSRLQRDILSVVWQYVKPGGTLVYSTCTIDPMENEGNAMWLSENFPLEPVDLSGRLGADFDEPSLKDGRIQFLPGIHPFDGFFISVFRRV
ncbi:16S rRNA (cytosine(967)-C(5))-methyltransferase RsmB [Lachnoclostridium pacaense]|uniref:16S rRNA (cytosine(967)-C(5))-methyltransferase RsmB n=1 Tax=Enterocloster hominis (ex Hitch et al. 2024) TaxID=1917870 RepID=UPI001D1072E4|nr:16S rRNA (cytosine(967)-C(5))-methyltransferase RsmB [Lachnoclostridium pacaense]MCC2820544.1 16S rRNA (cytosine(967)-C(5))-methyltransferase RsmB [Lachnoclostridium pacaense]